MASQTANTGFVLQPNYVNPALARDTSFRTMFPTAPPKDLLFNDILMAPAGSRQWDEQVADNGSEYRPVNQKFSITLARGDILDFSQGFLNFGASCTASDGSDVHFTQGIWNLFSRIRITCGSVVIFDQLEKNVFESFNYAFVRASNFDTTLGSIQGIGTPTQRIAWAKEANLTTYGIPLNIPLLTSEEMPMANTSNIVIEFYLAPPTSVVCKTAGSAPSATVDYKIVNPRMRFHAIEYQPDLQRQVNSIPILSYPYTNYKVFTTQIAANTTTFQYAIPVKVQGLIRMIAFMRPTANINNPNQVDALTTGFMNNGVLNYYLRVDNKYYPPTPLSAGGTSGYQQAYMEAFSCLDKAEQARLNKATEANNGTSALKNCERFLPSGSDFTSNRFAACLDLKTTTDNDPNYIQRFDVTPGNVQLLFNMNFDAGFPTTPQTLYLFMVHTSLGMCDIDGKWSLIE